VITPVKGRTAKIKKLVYSDVVKSASPDFNHKAAQKVFDLIMKMDDDEAREFVYHVANEIVETTIEKNLGPLQAHLNEVIAKRSERIRKAMLSLAEKDPERAAPYAAAFSEINKARLNPYDYGYRFEESDFRRDPGTGRFQAKVTTSQTKPIPKRTAQALGLPSSTETPEGRPNLSNKDLARYQDQYRQLSNFLATVKASSVNPGDKDVILHLRDRRTGQTYTTVTESTRPQEAGAKWEPTTEDLIGITARPNTLTAGGAYFGLASALGATAGTTGMRNTMNTLNTLDDGAAYDFASDWTVRQPGQNDTDKLYRRVSAGAQLAQAVGPPGSKIQIAGRMAEFVGDHGSEAEAVFGPPARKAAYRYRGVTRTPDSQLVQDYNTAISGAMSRSAVDPDRRRKIRAAQTRAVNRALQDKAAAHNKKNPKRPLDANAMKLSDAERVRILNDAAAKYQAEAPKLTDADREAGRLQIVEYLNRSKKQGGSKPEGGLYNLQLASGTTPPSEGVLIDKNGKIVAQAVGYGDDHYLPFNLKNLKSLRGGEYVRRRSVGGLTTEDIYTGLMAGAKQVTVVSRSGVFTMTFEEDFKGGRRYNDKALRMTKRYAQLLDAVQSEQVDNAKIPEEMRHAIRDEVKEEMGGFVSRPVLQQAITRREQEYKSSPELSEADEDRFRRIATLRAMAKGDRNVEAYLDEVRNEMAADKEFKFRLNGTGYAAALSALQEQFPYYIKVDSKPLRGHEGRIETELDRGYVEPGNNRPTFATAGLFGAKHRSPFENAGDKFSAASANYQRGLPRRGGGDGGDTPPPGPGLSPTGEKNEAVKANIANERKAVAFVGAAQALQAKMKSIDMGELAAEDKALLDMDAAALREPNNQAKFDTFVRRVMSAEGGKGAQLLGDAGAQYKVAAGHVGRKPFTEEEAGLWPEKPFTFTGGAHEPGAGYAAKAQALKDLDGRTGSSVLGTQRLSELDDKALEREHNVVRQMRDYMAEGLDAEGQTELLKGLGVVPGTPGTRRLVENPDLLPSHLKAIHEVRALKSELGPTGTIPVETMAQTKNVETKALEASKGAPDDILIQHAPMSTTERLQPRGRVKTLRDQFEKAAEYYADKGTDEGSEAADTLYMAAQTLHDEMPRVRSHADVEMLRSEHPASEQVKQAEELVMRMYGERQRR
jgi:hypothetical protein